MISDRKRLLLSVKYNLLEGISFKDTVCHTNFNGLRAIEKENGDFILQFSYGSFGIWYSEDELRSVRNIHKIVNALIEDKIPIKE